MKRFVGPFWAGWLFGLAVLPAQAIAQSDSPAAEPARNRNQARGAAPFRWVNPLRATDTPGLKHGTFRSGSMDLDVGYCIYLPPGYDTPEQAATRYPVVYYLHGGRPGSETKAVSIAGHVHRAITAGELPPVIYVFVNGGPVSHYNLPDREHAMGEDVFIKELIPHIDASYRTIARREGRAIEGFSQGGRGTARIIFRHPELFCSAAPGGGGHATEKRISENDGYENESLRFAPGDNTWDLAREFAKNPQPLPRILVYVGDQDFNYQANLDYLRHLESLNIPAERIIVAGVPHNAQQVYQHRGLDIMRFHAESFRALPADR